MAHVTKNILMGSVIIIVGALLGSFIGAFIGHAFPEGVIHDLFAKEISAGLSPTRLNLRVIEFTIGLVFNFNVPSVIGILISASILKSVLK